MRRNSRIIGFGGSGVLVVAGIVCAVAFGGTLGTVLAFILISAGLVLATSLIFLEVGLSEDRDRESEAERRQESQRPRDAERPYDAEGRLDADRQRQAEREREIERRRVAEGEHPDGERDHARGAGQPRRRPYLSRLRGERRHLK
jgi:hypothetical protein